MHYECISNVLISHVFRNKVSCKTIRLYWICPNCSMSHFTVEGSRRVQRSDGPTQTPTFVNMYVCYSLLCSVFRPIFLLLVPKGHCMICDLICTM